MAEVKLLVKLCINENSFGLVTAEAYWSLTKTVLVCILLKTMAHACHKLVQINKVWMLNLGLRKVKQETTAPQITLFYQTL